MLKRLKLYKLLRLPLAKKEYFKNSGQERARYKEHLIKSSSESASKNKGLKMGPFHERDGPSLGRTGFKETRLTLRWRHRMKIAQSKSANERKGIKAGEAKLAVQRSLIRAPK